MDEASAIDSARHEHSNDGWLIFTYPDNPPIRLDARVLDRVLVDDCYLVLSVAEVTVAFPITDGIKIAHSIAEGLMPYTRSAQIVDRDVYEDAKRRVDLVDELGRFAVPALFLGKSPMLISNGVVYVEDGAWLVADVENLAQANAELEVSTGVIQSRLVLLVIAARRRQDDRLVLSKRIEEYECGSGEY